MRRFRLLIVIVVSILLFFMFIAYIFLNKGISSDSREIRRTLSTYGFEGVYLVSRDGEIIAEGTLGRTSDRVRLSINKALPINSITKQFTGAAIYKLASEGKLSLDDAVGDFFNEAVYGADVKIYQLLNMSSGIPDYTGDEYLSTKYGPLYKRVIREEIKYRILKYSLEFEPGSEFKYCNSNYYLLGLIIEETTGIPYETYIEETFLKPLNMESTVFSYRNTVVSREYDHVYTFGAGCMGSTVRDLYKWQNALYRDMIDGVHISDIFISNPMYDMGIEYEDGRYSHNGKGYSCRSSMIYGEDNHIQVILLGVDNGKDTAEIADLIYEMLSS